MAERKGGAEAVGGVRMRNVIKVPVQGYRGDHCATFPQKLIEPLIKAGCPVGGTVLDPFGGVGTTGLVANQLERNAILVEINRPYAQEALLRIQNNRGMLSAVTIE